MGKQSPTRRRFPAAWILACGLILVWRAAGDPVHLETIPVSYEHAKLYAAGERVADESPIVLGAGPHLFIDEYLIASSEGLTRSVNQPERDPKIPNPVVDGPEDGCFQPYLSVLRDEKTGRFRIWYGRRTGDNNASRSKLGYMESPDGIHFERPARVLVEPGEIQFGVSVIDDGPNSAIAAQRFKYGWYIGDGLHVAASPDGIEWTALTPDTVLFHNHDISGIYRDTPRNRYVAISSVYRENDTWEGQRRITMASYSDDLLHWRDAHHIVLPDQSREDGEVQFYAIDGFLQRGDVTIGMVKVLRDDLKADDPPVPDNAYGIGYTSLAWTRDGETWVRDREPFFERDLAPDAWDHSHAWIDEQVPVGDDVYLYYGGYHHGHKVNRFEERQIGLVTMKRDRYVSWFPVKRGALRTRPLLLESTDLRVNVWAPDGGKLRARVLDASGTPIPGYDYEDSAPITGDQLEARVTWKKALSELKGRPVCLEFEMTEAALYAFYL